MHENEGGTAVALSSTFSAEFEVNTPIGTDVIVTDPVSGVTVKFAEVTNAGVTIVTTSDIGPTPPIGFKIVGGSPQYYEITTTAEYAVTIEIAIPYDPAQVKGSEGYLKLMQWDSVEAKWKDVTTWVDEVNNVIYGQVTALSIFAVMESEQYYLTVQTEPLGIATIPGEGWYDEGETAYAILAIGLDYVDTLAYGFVGWSGDASGWDLISEPIIMNAPKTAIANWEAGPVYEDVRTIGFWKHQVNVWYFTELEKTGMKIRGIGKAQIPEDELIAYLTFIDTNSDYFRGKIVKDNDGDGTIINLEILQNAYNFLETPTGPESMKMRAEQQLLALWLNLAHKAFFWNTQLSQDTLYIYYQYTYDDADGLATIGEAIRFCEAELTKTDSNYEAVKNICDSINNNLGIIWGT
ncbi:MAG: hypothetical protein AOA66_1633 [Candidatus Bathyarchaeota archaeon BA2]|nr:MAG: hypothetical protein AOA66_1633 [Candidatus Bathyarchaeota archaeon BA2]